MKSNLVYLFTRAKLPHPKGFFGGPLICVRCNRFFFTYHGNHQYC